MFKIIKLDKVDSTNITARDYPPGNVIVASVQEKGKGRFHREWESPLGGLWFSIVTAPSRMPFEYTFIASLAVLQSVGCGEIKWPNDILYSGRKLCGILSEVVSLGTDIDKIIVGVGLNVNNKSPSSGISLCDINGEKDLDLLLNNILIEFERISNIESEQMIEFYKSNCGVLGKEVVVKSMDKEIKGKAIDISNEGKLMIETSEGNVIVDEGDVMLKIQVSK